MDHTRFGHHGATHHHAFFLGQNGLCALKPRARRTPAFLQLFLARYLAAEKRKVTNIASRGSYGAQPLLGQQRPQTLCPQSRTEIPLGLQASSSQHGVGQVCLSEKEHIREDEGNPQPTPAGFSDANLFLLEKNKSDCLHFFLVVISLWPNIQKSSSL